MGTPCAVGDGHAWSPGGLMFCRDIAARPARGGKDDGADGRFRPRPCKNTIAPDLGARFYR